MKRISKTVTAGIISTLLFLIGGGLPVVGETFQYQYTEGEQYKIKAVVQQNVKVNGRFRNSAVSMYKTTVRVKEVRDGVGLLDGRFEVAERLAGQLNQYELGQTYESLFWRDSHGKLTMDDGAIMPVVRDVPYFDGGDKKPGDRWTADGREVHDLRRSFGIPEPLKVPIAVQYEYVGPEVKNNRRLHKIRIRYAIFEKLSPRASGFGVYPVRMSGYSDQLMYWDNVLGRPDSYSEEFSLILNLSDGQIYEFSGQGRAEVVSVDPADADRIARDLSSELTDDVKAVDQGVAITPEDLRFYPNSATLLPGEAEKLDRIARVLRQYPEKDILIVGHTALAGTAEARSELSLERARTISQALSRLGVSAPMTIEGRGAQDPVMSNDTEEGRRKNRRVEIILEN